MKTFVKFLNILLAAVMAITLVVGYILMRVELKIPFSTTEISLMEIAFYYICHVVLPAILVQRLLRKFTAFVSVKSVSHF